MNSINEKLLIELNKLLDISKMNDYKLNYITIVNLLNESNFDINNINEIISYFNSNNIDIVFDDIEEDSLTDLKNISDKIKPFDQTKIDISMKTLTLDLIIKRLENNEINLMPDFQRKGGLWNEEQKSRLIESLMLRIPLPAFYFDGTKDDEWLIIDGLQRLTAIKEFFVDKKLTLKNLEFLKDFNNSTYKQLPRTYSRRMEETQIVAYIINPGTPVPVKYNIFKRINTSGLELQPQEIRHALYQGNATKLLSELASNNNFILATGQSIRTDRMQDRELVLRFLAFRENGIDNYEGIIDDFLNDTMELINTYNDIQINELQYQFDKSMKLCYGVFQDKAFRKIYSRDDRKNPINKALFDVWSVIFSLVPDNEINKVLQRKDIIIDNFISMMNDDRSNLDADTNSGKIPAVKRRFENMKKMLEDILGD